MQVFGDFGGDDFGGGEIGGVFEAVVFEPKDVEVGFVALDQVLVGERLEAVGLFALVAIFRTVAGDEVVEVGALQRIGFQGEVLVGAEVVDPKRLGPGSFAGGLAVEEEDVGLDALGVEDAGGQAEKGVHIAFVKEFAANGFAGSAFEEDVIGDDDGGASLDFQERLDVLEEI